MCGIMGFTSQTLSEEEIREYFDRTIPRGPDMSRIEKTQTGYLCFHRLAIMGLTKEGMQPFHMHGDMCVCNGELYLFRPLKAELEQDYTFQSGSDCEIILPLYHKYGLDMFSKLDAEFAMLIYDAEEETLIAARDPIGIRPLFYGTMSDGSMVFASEAKNLVGLCEEICPFPPGHYYYKGQFVRYADVTEVRKTVTGELDDICRKIRELLILGVDKRLDADAPLGFLLSGGLDSSLVCAIAARLLGKPIRTFAIGMDKDAIDLKYLPFHLRAHPQKTRGKTRLRVVLYHLRHRRPAPRHEGDHEGPGDLYHAVSSQERSLRDLPGEGQPSVPRGLPEERGKRLPPFGDRKALRRLCREIEKRQRHGFRRSDPEHRPASGGFPRRSLLLSAALPLHSGG